MGWCALTHLIETLAPDQEGVVPVEASTKSLLERPALDGRLARPAQSTAVANGGLGRSTAGVAEE